jgi:hypothetical protein
MTKKIAGNKLSIFQENQIEPTLLINKMEILMQSLFCLPKPHKTPNVNNVCSHIITPMTILGLLCSCTEFTHISIIFNDPIGGIMEWRTHRHRYTIGYHLCDNCLNGKQAHLYPRVCWFKIYALKLFFIIFLQHK